MDPAQKEARNARVLETIKGTPLVELGSSFVFGNVQHAVQSGLGPATGVRRIRRALVFKFDFEAAGTSSIQVGRCWPVVDTGGATTAVFEEAVVEARAYARLRAAPSVGAVQEALASEAQGERTAAIMVLRAVDSTAFTGSVWDGLGPALVEDYRRFPLDRASRQWRLPVLRVALERSRRWREAEGLPAAAWWPDAGLVLLGRFESPADRGAMLCDGIRWALPGVRCEHSPVPSVELKRRIRRELEAASRGAE